MSRFAMTPSQVPEGSYVVAVCSRCGDHRYLSRALMIEKVGDVLLDEIERRVRCIARPWSNKRGPACGGKMELEFGAVSLGETEAKGGWPKIRLDAKRESNTPPIR